MKPSVKRLLNMLFILATLALIVIIAFSNGEMTNAWTTLWTLDLRWVLCALLGWFAYLFFDAVSLHCFLRKQHHRISMPYATYVSLIGFYYGNITPGASGGQPMQIYYMNKKGIPVGVGSSAISLKFFCTQAVTVLMASVLWLCNRDFVTAQLGGAQWAIVLGWCINFVAIPGILLVALCRPLVQAVLKFGVNVGAKLRLVKNPESAMLRATSVLDTYHSSILRIGRHPWQIALQMLLAALSMLGLMSVPLSVYHAFGLSGAPWHQLLTVAFLLFLSASYTPLPGASGAQEGGFLVYYRGLFTQGTIGLALLVWRFFTYYLFLIVGAVISIVGNLRSGRKKAESPAPPADT
ncbi:MAG: lysylphosphatidylglycerol synthase transmembrane domain-containing protein [Eubacteriales bacterium]|nr:lysylphosphatidylglycerol synthase transmembrane domain-containing protein [Eubacteriales bacterium]